MAATLTYPGLDGIEANEIEDRRQDLRTRALVAAGNRCALMLARCADELYWQTGEEAPNKRAWKAVEDWRAEVAHLRGGAR